MSAHELHLLDRAKNVQRPSGAIPLLFRNLPNRYDFRHLPAAASIERLSRAGLYFLSGLNSDGSELIRQTGIQRFAAQWNIIVVFPDTSPRGSHISDSTNELSDKAAGFYVGCDRTTVGSALSNVQPYQP